MFTAHGQRRLFTSFQSKIWPRLSLRRHLFPVTVEKLFCENTCSLFCDFFSAHAQKRLFRSFRSKVWPPPFAPSTSITYKTRCISTTEWRLLDRPIIRCFCATASHDLVTLTFDLLTLAVFCVYCFSCPTHILIFIILRTTIIGYWIWSHFRYQAQSLRMRNVKWPIIGG